jgi:hypothetical protein
MKNPTFFTLLCVLFCSCLMAHSPGRFVNHGIDRSINRAPASLGITGPITGPKYMAVWDTAVFSISPVQGATLYTWTAPTGCKINGHAAPVVLNALAGTKVTVVFSGASGNICVTPSSPAETGATSCIYVATNSHLATPCPNSFTPAADRCEDACVYCNFTGYSGSTAGYTADTLNEFCGTLENGQWVGFVAGTTDVTIKGIAYNCFTGSGIQLSVVEDCKGVPVEGGCYKGCVNCMNDTARVQMKLNPGQQYFLLVDGWAGDQCDFTITVSPGNGATAQPIGIPGNIQGPAVSCPGTKVEYSIPPVANAGGYLWTAPPGSLINGKPSPFYLANINGNTVTVTFGSIAGSICVQPMNACSAGSTKCKPVTLKAIPPTVLPSVTVCADDIPYALPWGDLASASGLYTHTYASYRGCDSIIQKTVTVRAPVAHTLDPIAICVGACATIGGQSYCDAGNYSLVYNTTNGCDSTVNFTVVVLQPNAQIYGDNLLNCTNPSLEINAAPASGTITWKNGGGQIVGSNASLLVSAPDLYILEVEASAGSQTCFARDSITVTIDNTAPVVTVSGGQINCAQTSVQINAQTMLSTVTYAWTGPDGFSSELQNPAVALPGNYTVVVTNPGNGCTASAGASVVADLQPPFLQATGGSLNCATPSIHLNAGNSAANVSFQWNGPSGFQSAGPSPAVDLPGDYTVTATDIVNQCTSTATVVVEQHMEAPAVQIEGSTQVNCSHPDIILTAQTSAPSATFQWSGPNGLLTSGPMLAVSDSGQYHLTITDTDNGCTATSSTGITADFDRPAFVVQGDTITCSKLVAGLHCQTNLQGATFAWSGPNGPYSPLQNPLTNFAGMYTVSVTNISSGCAATGTAQVIKDTIPPADVIIDPPATLTCLVQQVTLYGNAGNSTVQYFWDWPDTAASQQDVIVTYPGIYTLVVRGQNGCTTIATTFVEQNNTVPPIETGLAGTLDCAHNSLEIDYTGFGNIVVTGPAGNGITLSDHKIIATQPGTYNLSYTQLPGGCTSSFLFSVASNYTQPVITLAALEDDLNSQGSGAIQIDIAGGTAPYSVEWLKNGQPFSNQEDLSGLSAGTYNVVTTGTNGCTGSAEFVVHNTVPTLEPEAAENWLVYPNPASDLLHIRFAGDNMTEAGIKLFDTTGKVVYEQISGAANDFNINLNNLPNGPYILYVRTGARLFKTMVVISR